MGIGVNVQVGTVTVADVADLRRFDAALLICDWPAALPATLAVLDVAHVPVGLWRWTQDPRIYTGWPEQHQARCPWALFANEPDLPAESWPAWYDAACAAWRHAGGKLVEPALSDEGRYAALGMARVEQALAVATGHGYDALSAHCYAGDVHNLTAVRARAAGRPVVVSEYAHQDHQKDVLQELADAGVAEPVYLFIYRWKPPGNVAGYDLAGVGLTPANAPPIAPAVPARKAPIVTATDYCTQIDPFGSGEERCGPAGGASAQCSLIPGNYDNYQLMRQWTAAINTLHGDPNYVQHNGCTSADLIAVAPQFHLTARLWTTWDEYMAATGKGEIVLALLQNKYLEPRPYPAAAGWDAQHFVRVEPLVYNGKTDGVFLLGFDPLCYVLGEYSGAYQGPLCFTIQSVRAAIQASTADEAGVIFSKAG